MAHPIRRVQHKRVAPADLYGYRVTDGNVDEYPAGIRLRSTEQQLAVHSHQHVAGSQHTVLGRQPSRQNGLDLKIKGIQKAVAVSSVRVTLSKSAPYSEWGPGLFPGEFDDGIERHLTFC